VELIFNTQTLISGFRRDVDEICGLLGNYMASCGNNYHTTPCNYPKDHRLHLILKVSKSTWNSGGKLMYLVKTLFLLHLQKMWNAEFSNTMMGTLCARHVILKNAMPLLVMSFLTFPHTIG
jgi:hypothetical protein